jgi:hypothetical protein
MASSNLPKANGLLKVAVFLLVCIVIEYLLVGGLPAH